MFKEYSQSRKLKESYEVLGCEQFAEMVWNDAMNKSKHIIRNYKEELEEKEEHIEILQKQIKYLKFCRQREDSVV